MEKQHTKAYIIEGVKAALAAGLSVRTISAQVAEIIDARLDCVLLPNSEKPKTNHAHESIRKYHGSKLDGMVEKYSEVPLEDHNTGAKITLSDLQRADDDMRRRVEKAMTTLKGVAWKLPPSSVAALCKPYGNIASPETNNSEITLQRVTWADFDSALTRLGFDPAAPTDSNPRTRSWTIKTPTQKRVFGSIQGQKLPTGDVFTLDGTKKKLTSLDPASLRHIIDEYVQAGITVVY